MFEVVQETLFALACSCIRSDNLEMSLVTWGGGPYLRRAELA